MSEQNTLPQGGRVGSYRVERVRHIGRYTIDYDARDDAGRVVLLREFYPAEYSQRDGLEAHARDAEDRGPLRWWLRSFLDRWQAAARVQPAGLVRVHAVLEANATAYVALEPFAGEDLNSLLQHRGRLAERELGIAFAPVAEALMALHAAGVAPVDLGPDTVCVAADGRAVLTDIGSLRAPIRLKSGWLMTTARPPFAAPEQLRPGSQAAAASDSYALGALLLMALTGTPPPDLDGQPLPDLDSLCSPPLAAAIRSALSVEPAQRPDAAALIEVLGGGERPIAAALRPAPSPARRSSPLKFAVVAGIVALLAVGVFYFLHPRAKPTAAPAPTVSTKPPAGTLAAAGSTPPPAASAHRAPPTPAVSLDQLALDLLKKQQELRAQQQAAAEDKRKVEAKKPAEQAGQAPSAAAIAAAKAAAAAEAQRRQQALEAEVKRLQEQLKARQQAEQQAAAQKAQQAAAEQAKQKAAEEQARLEAEARHIREVAAKAMKDCAIPAPKLSVDNNLIYDTALQVPGARKLSSGAIRLPPVRLADGTTEQFDITPDSCAHRVRY